VTGLPKQDRPQPMLRRRALGWLAGVLGASAVAALGRRAVGLVTKAVGEQSEDMVRSMLTPSAPRLPVIYLPHGGGPWPFVDLGRFVGPGEADALRGYLENLTRDLAPAPRALLVISAHWEEPVPTVMTAEHPPMLYDYFGFPEESYRIKWDAPGDRQLATRVRELLSLGGIDSAENAERGFDHGTFVPLKVAFPKAELPTVQLSLKRGLDPAEHLALGRALAPLREEGVLIVGSGMSFHNLRAFGHPTARAVAETFDAWLCEAGQAEPSVRDEQLIAWAKAPQARQAHPREEHLLPLMVIAGAAGTDSGRVGFSGTFGGMRISALHYG
jgi:aromatic ring-opening dioxygenase catalytic subunit (LigB family)